MVSHPVNTQIYQSLPKVFLDYQGTRFFDCSYLWKKSMNVFKFLYVDHIGESIQKKTK